MGTEIIVCDQPFDIGHPVHNFKDKQNGYDAYIEGRTDNSGQIFASHPAPGMATRARRYRYRRRMGKRWREMNPKRALARLRKSVRQFVIHLDGCKDANMCYTVLHNQRGLSVHFMVDNDGTIYQTLDLADCAFHAGGVNEVSVGVELQNRGDARRFPNYKWYTGKNAREVVTCRVHGYLFKAYAFTDGQYKAMIAISRAMNEILNMPLVSPQTDGAPVLGLISQPRRFAGFLGHYHIERQKWDPGPWDFQRMFRGNNSKLTFPFSRLKKEKRTPRARDEDRRLNKEARQYFEKSEGTIGAYFPVGPLGRSRLWHGGVHLAAAEGTPIYAPLKGQMVAARMSSPCPVGSCNMILLRHHLASHLGQRVFYLLFFHLRQEEDNRFMQKIVPWLVRTREEQWRKDLALGRVAMMNEEVEAGELIAHVGSAGPPGSRSSQVHFAVFSPRDITRGLEDDKSPFWEIIKTPATKRLCDDAKIVGRIDTKGRRGDQYLSRKELREFFRYSGLRRELRRVGVKHLSEWTDNGWAEALEDAPDFARLPDKEKKRLIAQQITPTLWWTPEVASHAGLPSNGVVYSYHPVSFLLWFKQVMRRSASSRAVGIGSEEQYNNAKKEEQAPDTFKLDSESSHGVTDDEDRFTGHTSKKLTLEELANGYPDNK